MTQHETSDGNRAKCDLPQGNRPIVSFRGISKRYGGNVVLDSVSAEAQRGEIVLIQGENGSGKTTLLNILTGNIPPDAGSIEAHIDGHDANCEFTTTIWHHQKGRSAFRPECFARAGIGRTWQDMRLFDTQSVIENIAVGAPKQLGEFLLALAFRPSRVATQERAIQIESRSRMTQVGLPSTLADQLSRTLSLGQAKRATIARAVNGAPRLLFLDEPLAGLDEEGAQAAVSLIDSLVKQHRLTAIIVEHATNVHYFSPVATRSWTLAGHQLIQDVAPSDGLRIETLHRPCRREMIAQASNVEILRLGSGARLTISRRTKSEDVSPLFHVKGIRVTRNTFNGSVSKGPNEAVSAIDIRLSSGDIAVLDAPNGWGKSTLFDAIAGIIPHTAEVMRIRDTNINHAPAWRRRQAGVCLLSGGTKDFPQLTVRESLSLSGVRDVPEDVRPFLSRRLGGLSGGERQRVALTAALYANESPVLLLDEPFSGLDAPGTALWIGRLLEQAKQRATLIALPSEARYDIDSALTLDTKGQGRE